MRAAVRSVHVPTSATEAQYCRRLAIGLVSALHRRPLLRLRRLTEALSEPLGEFGGELGAGKGGQGAAAAEAWAYDAMLAHAAERSPLTAVPQQRRARPAFPYLPSPSSRYSGASFVGGASAAGASEIGASGTGAFAPGMSATFVPTDRAAAAGELAVYAHAVQHLPYYYAQAEMWMELVGLLRSLSFLQAKITVRVFTAWAWLNYLFDFMVELLISCSSCEPSVPSPFSPPSSPPFVPPCL